MTALLPDRTTRSAAEVGHDLRHRRPARPPGAAGRRPRRGRHPRRLPRRRRRRLVPHRRRCARRPARRPADRRPGLADGARVRRPRRRRAGHRDAAGDHAGLRVGGLAHGVPPRRLGLRATGPTPTGSPTASATGPSRSRRALFLVGYVATAVVAGSLASTTVDAARHLPRRAVVGACCAGLLGAPAIAAGSGPGLDLGLVPAGLGRRHRRGLPLGPDHLAAGWPWRSSSARCVLDTGTALNLVSQLGTDGPATGLLALVSLLLVPNAVLFSGSYLLGPGFAVGVRHGRVARPGHRGCAAGVPDARRAARQRADARVDRRGWSSCRRSSPGSAPSAPSAVAPRSATRRARCTAAPAGCSPALAFALLASLAGGRVGPGRMTDVGPEVFPVLLHAVTAFGIGGLLGGLAITWWQRRAAEPAADADL